MPAISSHALPCASALAIAVLWLLFTHCLGHPQSNHAPASKGMLACGEQHPLQIRAKLHENNQL
jgi:hypothetical protein